MGIVRQMLVSGGSGLGTGQIDVGTMASGSSIALPLIVMRGAKPGKTLWLNGQVHGDEINGIIASLEFVKSLDATRMSGNVVVTPTGNPAALDARRKRTPSDELDLDQQYPGSRSGLITDRMAHALISEIDGAADFVVNLHTMNPLFDSKPYAVYKLHPKRSEDERTILTCASYFNPNVVCRMDVNSKAELPGNIAGALDYQCQELGIPSFMVELGCGSRYQRDNIDLAKRGFTAMVRYLGILEGDPAPSPISLRLCTKRGWITAAKGGLFIPAVVAGDNAAAGCEIGKTMDLFGNIVEAPAVSQDSILIGLRSDPVVHTGERLAFIAHQWETVTLA